MFPTNQKKVLVIDDDRTLLRQISLHFEKQRGFITLLAECAEDGFNVARKQYIDLIILDWTLPGMQGIELLAALKNEQKTKHIPVLMLTSHSKINDAEDAFKLGASGYMFKPFSLKRLAEKSSLLMT